MKILVTKVFLNDIIGVEELGVCGIIKQKKMAIASNNDEQRCIQNFRLLEANAFEGGA